MMNYFEQQKWLRWAFVLLLVLNIAILALLFKERFPEKKHFAHKSPKVLLIEELEMSEEQQASYETLIDVHRTVSADLHDQLRAKKREYFKGIGTESKAQQEEEMERILALQRKLEDLTYRHFTSVRELLNPEQQEKFDTVIPEVIGMMLRGPGGPKPGKHGPPPPPH